MNFSEWIERGAAGREAAARSAAAAIVREATGAGDDTVLFGSAVYGHAADEPLVVTLWAATTAGFATARVTTNPDPRLPDRAGISLSVEAWQRIAVLRLNGVSPLDERLAVTLTVGSTSIPSTEGNAQEVAALYRACASNLSRT